VSRLGALVAALLAVACGAPPPAPPAAPPSPPPAPRECVEVPRSNHEPDQYRTGLELLRRVEAGEPEQAPAAQEALAKCVEQDPRFVDCHFQLGEVALWMDDEQLADQRYRRAIEIDPTRAEPYLRLAELYAAYRLDDAAAAVLSEALRFVPVQGAQAAGRFPILVRLAHLEVKGDHADRALAHLQQAEPFADAGPPIFSYALASAYLEADPKPESERQQKLTAWMKRFHEQGCGAESPKEYRAQCDTAYVWMIRFGETP